MRFSTAAVSVVLAAIVSTVSAVDHIVQVGAGGALTFEPPTLNPAVGDIVKFNFLSKNHTVTQSTFASPCQPKPNGADSGYQFVPPNSADQGIAQWSIEIVNGEEPIWFYCAQGNHCAQGMVFAINPSAERTFEAFLATAKSSGGAAGGAGGGAAGGSGGGAAGQTISVTPTTPAVGPSGVANAAQAAQTTSAAGKGAGINVVAVLGAVLLGVLAL